MLSVLLVEDDFDLAETVIDYLAIESISCDYAGNGVAGQKLLADNAYDVVLLDLNLPRLDGLTLCRDLRLKGDDTPVLMLTARDRLDDKVDGFKAGTDDYLVKPFELRELVVRIHALARRRSGQVKLLSCADLEMNLKEDVVTRAGRYIKLSPIARQILETLLRAAPETVPKQKLIDAVWGDDPPDSNSLKVHMHHLRKAVDDGFGVQLIHTIPGRGFSIKEGD
ncbi:MAG: response regulator transcription factor [Desulfobacterales bacterium]|nr:response regulator transcription factor [Desulfobacterales bacterium]